MGQQLSKLFKLHKFHWLTKIIIITNFCYLPLLVAQNNTTLSLSGIVYEKGTRIPLKNTNVFILPYKLKTTTDEKGEFHFTNVPPGELQYVVNLSGYYKFELNKTYQLTDDVQSPLKLYVEKINDTGFETVVVGQKKKIDGSQKTLTQKEILSLPGANGDPVKAVQNLPGVNRVSGFSSQIVIQGSSPQDTHYDIDGHEIPLVFHFGGLSSVVIPEALSEVDYLSAGYGALYSRAQGGIISLRSRDPEVIDRPHKGFFFVDTQKAGGLYETRIDDSSSILIAGRISYIGFVLGKIAEKQSNFNLTVAPEFSDLTIIYNKKWGQQDELKTVFVSSNDQLGFLIKQPVDSDPSLRGTLSNNTFFYRLIPQWTRHWDETNTSHLSAAIGEDQTKTEFGTNYFKLISRVLTVRGDWERQITKNWQAQLGFDNQYSYAQVFTHIPKVTSEGGISNPIGSADIVDLNVNGKLLNIGIYEKNDIQSGDWTYIPAVRLDRFHETNETFLLPRLEVKNKLSPSLQIKFAWGMYAQPPQPQEFSADFGNPDIKAPQVDHYTIGFDKDFKENNSAGWRWTTTAFLKNYKKQIIPSKNTFYKNGTLQAENYNNNGTGRSQGIETLIRYEGSPSWTGWIAYTYSKSTRTSPPQSENLFQYDQTHNLNLIASTPLPRNWTMAGRFRYTTGNPFTPILDGTLDSDSDVYLPIRGGIYSERYPAYSSLDLRFDKKWILDEQIWSLYIDIENALNQKTFENYQYSYNYKQKEMITGLPLIPNIGLKGEF